jgi:hypothetical protein
MKFKKKKLGVRMNTAYINYTTLFAHHFDSRGYQTYW